MLTEQEEGKVRTIIGAFDNGKSVTELNAATTLGDNDVMEVLQGGENKKVPVSVVKESVNSDVLTEVNKRGVFNATVSVPLSAGTYYTLSTAIASVPTASKTLGLDLKFSTGANTWVVYRYKGTDLSGWATTTNWEQVPDAAKLTSLETDLNTYNATYSKPLVAGQYYDLASAIAAVPVANRKLGLKLTYMSALYEKDTLTITSAPNSSSNIVITLNGVSVSIALDSAVDTTPSLVATKIKSATFTGWTLSGTGAVVIFTKNVVGACSTPIFDAGTTGVTASFERTVVGTSETVMEYQFNGNSISTWLTQSNWRKTTNTDDLSVIQNKWIIGKYLNGKIVVEGDYYHRTFALNGEDIHYSNLYNSTFMYIDAINFFDKNGLYISKKQGLVDGYNSGIILSSDIPFGAALIGITTELSKISYDGISSGVYTNLSDSLILSSLALKRIDSLSQSVDNLTLGVNNLTNETTNISDELANIKSNKGQLINILDGYKCNSNDIFLNASGIVTNITDEGAVITISNSVNRFFGFSQTFNVLAGERYVLVLETFGETTIAFDIIPFINGMVTNSLVGHVHYSIDHRFKSFQITAEKTGTMQLKFLSLASTGTSKITIKHASLIKLGTLDDSRYDLFQKLGSQYFIELCCATSFNPNHYSEKPLIYNWGGKKMVSIGDSTVFSCNWQPSVAEQLSMIWSRVETITGDGVHKPMAVGGSMIVPYVSGSGGTASGNSIYMRADDVKYYNPDVIFLLGGINDGWSNPNGTISDEPYTGAEFTDWAQSTATFYSYYKGVVYKLITQNPNAKIVLIVPCMPFCGTVQSTRNSKNNMDAFSVMVREIAEYYGCLFVDTNHCWGINEYNIGVLNEDKTTYIDVRYYRNDGLVYGSNGSVPHPNEAGGRRLAQAIVNVIK